MTQAEAIGISNANMAFDQANDYDTLADAIASCWDNVQDMFVASFKNTNYGHILIIDDVITTGATLESLARAIKATDPKVQISLLSFAFTK